MSGAPPRSRATTGLHERLDARHVGVRVDVVVVLHGLRVPAERLVALGAQVARVVQPLLVVGVQLRGLRELLDALLEVLLLVQVDATAVVVGRARVRVELRCERE